MIHILAGSTVYVSVFDIVFNINHEWLKILSVAKDALPLASAHPESFYVIGSGNVFVISLWGDAFCQFLSGN